MPRAVPCVQACGREEECINTYKWLEDNHPVPKVCCWFLGLMAFGVQGGFDSSWLVGLVGLGLGFRVQGSQLGFRVRVGHCMIGCNTH